MKKIVYNFKLETHEQLPEPLPSDYDFSCLLPQNEIVQTYYNILLAQEISPKDAAIKTLSSANFHTINKISTQTLAG